jgi:hypothetical protein
MTKLARLSSLVRASTLALFVLMTVMPTRRLIVPVGPVEPHAAFGMGYGFIPKTSHGDFATTSRLGIVFRFSESFALGVEGTFQKLDGSIFRFPSFGSMVSLDL